LDLQLRKLKVRNQSEPACGGGSLYFLALGGRSRLLADAQNFGVSGLTRPNEAVIQVTWLCNAIDGVGIINFLLP
jgi:hypothetical protein